MEKDGSTKVDIICRLKEEERRRLRYAPVALAYEALEERKGYFLRGSIAMYTM